MSWGALRGAYLSTERGKPVVGGKPVGAMREIVRDYSRPGDVVCDPCFGGGTTLLAAKLEGRRAIGSEMDPASHEIAKSRLCKFPTSATQASLFGEE
jgi:DNA modification methylase